MIDNRARAGKLLFLFIREDQLPNFFDALPGNSSHFVIVVQDRTYDVGQSVAYAIMGRAFTLVYITQPAFLVFKAMSSSFKCLPSIMADRDKLKQVFLNLCKNAVEAMGEGGVLTIVPYPETVQKIERMVVQIGPFGDECFVIMNIIFVFAD
ncbi:hypothetical protein BG52_05930 [Paenibacillus darwinianus]|nr:hypothetical protein CH50_07600 [Paenibacillus darwinianus]EXX86655.1 hypothetical protein BG52_05930 [Paenibacillus darwinianus]